MFKGVQETFYFTFDPTPFIVTTALTLMDFGIMASNYLFN